MSFQAIVSFVLSVKCILTYLISYDVLPVNAAHEEHKLKA